MPAGRSPHRSGRAPRPPHQPCARGSLRRHDGAMQHVRLGRTGLQVSRICLGTMTFGLQCRRTDVASRSSTTRPRGGITFLDTADVYPLGGDLTTVGRTEEIVGRWLQGKRDQYVVATKCFGPMGTEPVGHGQQPPPHHGRDRRVAAAPADRLHRPVPAALRRSRRAARRDARRARRPRARRQGALRRLLELPRVPARARARPQRGAAASRASTRCSPATTCCSASSNASCSRSASKRASA